MDQVQLISLLLALLFSFVSIFLGSHPVTKGSKLPRVTLVSDLDIFKQQLLVDIEMLLIRYCTSKGSNDQQISTQQFKEQQFITNDTLQQLLPVLIAIQQLLATNQQPLATNQQQTTTQSELKEGVE